MSLTDVNPLAIALATIINLALRGFILHGNRPKTKNQYFATIIIALVLSYSVAILIKTTNAYTFFGALKVGLLVGVGVAGMSILPDYISTGRLKHFLFNFSFQVLIILIASILMVALP